MALKDPWPGGDDDTDLDYYDTAQGNIWCPDAPPQSETWAPEAGGQVAHQPPSAPMRSEPEPNARTGRPMITQQAHQCPNCQQRFTSRREVATHRRETHPPTRPPALIRFAHALRAVHQELEIASECLLRPIPPPQADPLAWIQTRGGYCLAGRYLPTPPGQTGSDSGHAGL
jgi:hypothetical protein